MYYVLLKNLLELKYVSLLGWLVVVVGGGITIVAEIKFQLQFH
jgi:hypothetical protein